MKTTQNWNDTDWQNFLAECALQRAAIEDIRDFYEPIDEYYVTDLSPVKLGEMRVINPAMVLARLCGVPVRGLLDTEYGGVTIARHAIRHDQQGYPSGGLPEGVVIPHHIRTALCEAAGMVYETTADGVGRVFSRGAYQQMLDAQQNLAQEEAVAAQAKSVIAVTADTHEPATDDRMTRDFAQIRAVEIGLDAVIQRNVPGRGTCWTPAKRKDK